MESIFVIILLQAFVFGAFCSFIAKEKNRDAVEWFFLGFFFSFLAVLTLVAIPRREEPTIENITAKSENSSLAQKAICPFCKEEIRPDAILCKHCKSDLNKMKPILIPNQLVPTIEPIAPAGSFVISCPNCHESQNILLSDKLNIDAYKKFSPNYSQMFNAHLRCKKCGTKIPYNPYK